MIDCIAVLTNSLNHDLMRLNSISQNLANVSTAGYKKESVSFDQLMASDLTGNASDRLQPGYYKIRPITQGGLSYTGDPSTISLDGKGLFLVEKNGSLFGFRGGKLLVNANGELITSDGEKVQGRSSTIMLESGPFEIDESGVIMQNGNVIDKLRIVNSDDVNAQEYLGSGLYKLAANSPGEVNDLVRVKQGFIETSNVKTMDEMVQLIDTTRHFESIYNVLKAYDGQMNMVINRLANF